MHAQSYSADSYLVHVDVPGARLEGQLAIPPSPRGVVLFAHGSGSSRHSPRNKFVAQYLRDDAHTATLLIDLLSSSEEAFDDRTRELRFDIGFLARRLAAIGDWLTADRRVQELPI